MTSTEQRAVKFLSGTGKAVLPKADLYKSAAAHHRLKQAVEANFTSVHEWELWKRKQTHEFYRDVLKCK